LEKELETEFEKQFGGGKAKIGLVVCAVLVAILAVSDIWFFLMVNTLETDKNSLQSQVTGLQTDKNNLQSQVDSLETWLEGNKTSLGELEEKYSTLKVTYDTLYSDFASLQSEYEYMQSQHQALTETYGSLYQNYSSLETEYTKLTTNFTALKGQYTELIQNYTNLLNQYNEVSANYTSLQATYQNLLTNYSNLEVQYGWLQSNHTILQTDYDTLQTQYNSLQLLYDDLQTEYDSYVTAYQRLRDEINHRWGLQNLETFITPEDSTVNTYVLGITGGWSNPDDWDEYWDDLKAMYNWVVDNIEYRYDGLYPNLPDDPSGAVDYWKEMWQFPNETLDLRQGDCEDMAILLCSMIICYGDMQYDTECIGITSSTAGHLAVQCPVEDYKLVIFDPAGDYYSSDWFGNIVFNNISTEIDNWLDYWKPEIGNDVYVDLVFSDYIHETFISTDDYIAWMYSR
jgi:peptidoglycan hydrolase CwlO-like protein